MNHVNTQFELELPIIEVNNELQTRIENFERLGSGLVYEKFLSMQIEIYEANPLRSGTYKELTIINQATLINKNSDMVCTLWSISVETSPSTTNQNCTSIYVQHFNRLNIRGFDYTIGLKIVQINRN